MKVFISVDMEGIGGISHRSLVLRGSDSYAEGVRLMVAETNAAIEGAFTGGATAVTVNDSHGDQYNLTRADLDPRARLIQGRKPLGMVQGADPERGFGVALMVGYHARAGTGGTLAHTMLTVGPTEVRLNGRAVGETGLNAAYLAAAGIPVGMVAGDDVLAAEVADWLPWSERVVVKESVAQWAADSVHPSTACDLVRTGAEHAVSRAIAGNLNLLHVEAPVVIEVDFHYPGQAEFAELVPGIERTGASSVRLAGADIVTAYRTMQAVLQLGLGAA